MSSSITRLKALRTVKPVAFAGDTFHIRSVSIKELGTLDDHAGDSQGTERRVRYGRALLALSLCEADGSKVFTGPDDPDMDEVPTDALRALVDASADLNGLSGGEGEGDEGNG